MKTVHFFSKAMLLVTCITSGLYANIYLSNDSGWDIKFKFAQPERIVPQNAEVLLKNGTRYDFEDANDIVHISIRRSGFGSSFASPWTQLNVADLRNATAQFLSSRPTNPRFDQHILWSITSAGTGWDVKVKGFSTPKK
jgi:hypothetical protein